MGCEASCSIYCYVSIAHVLVSATRSASCLRAMIHFVTLLSQGQSCPPGAQQGLPDPHQHRQGWALPSQGHRLQSPENQQTLLTKCLQQMDPLGQEILIYKGTTHPVHLWSVVYCTQVSWHAHAFPACFATTLVAQQRLYRTL